MFVGSFQGLVALGGIILIDQGLVAIDGGNSEVRDLPVVIYVGVFVSGGGTYRRTILEPSLVVVYQTLDISRIFFFVSHTIERKNYPRP